MPTKFDICSAALTRSGSEPIASFTGTSAGARIAAENYETVVKDEMSKHPWKRASKIIELDLIDSDIEGEPPEPWTAAYTLPSDLLEIRTLRVSGMNIDYEVHGNTVLCNASEADQVILHYVWREDEAYWPPWFTEGVIRRLEAVFLRGIGERYKEAALRDRAADEQFAKAKHRDSQSQTARDPSPSPTLAARRGEIANTRPARPDSWMDLWGS
jgi:hypothetical protein